MAARRKKALAMKRAMPKIKRAKARNAMRPATREEIIKAAYIQAKKKLELKITKGIPKSQLSIKGKEKVEKIIRSKKSAIERIAKKLIPLVKAAKKKALLKKKGKEAEDSSPNLDK